MTAPVSVGHPVKAPNRLSASSTLSFQQCPAKFYYEKIAKLPSYPSKESLLGNFVHEVLEDLYGLPPEERTLDRAKVLLRTHWESKFVNQVKTLRPRMKDDELKKWRWQAFWCVEKLFSMESPESIQFDGLETRVSGKIAGVDFLGFVDRYHSTPEGLVVGDYKTGKHDPRYVSDKVFQMAVYALLGEQTLGKPVVRAELIFLKSGDVFAIDPDEGVRESAIETVSTVVTSLNQSSLSGEFETNKTRLCDWCSFKSECPAWD